MFATLTLLLAILPSPVWTNSVYQGNAAAILQNLLVLREDNGTRRLFVRHDGLKDFAPGDRLAVEIVPPTKPLNRLPRVIKSITRLGDGAKEAPLDCTIDEPRTDAHHLDLVRIRGHVEDLVRDEIAPDWINLVVRSSNACILVIAPFRETDAETVNPVSGDARVAIRFAVSRSSLSDTTTHAILRIIRELVANAVTHGKATQIRIAGEHHDDRLSFSVTDNGCGFDPQRRPGAGNGHFGLSGIEERLTRCGGSFNLESTAGKGTRAVASIPIPRGQGDARE